MPDRFADMVSAEIARGAERARALVVVPQDRQSDPLDCFAGLRANFLAHLIATRDRLPQTLSLRRVSPDVAVHTYAAGPSPSGQTHESRTV